MKKILILLVISFNLIFPVGLKISYAFSPLQQACSAGGSTSGASVCQDQSGSNTFYGPNGILDKIINLFSIVIGIVAVFAIMVAGFIYVTSGGDSAKVNTAKNTILYVVVGLVIVAIAQVIEAFVINNLGNP
jgi:hypothetical protein